MGIESSRQGLETSYRDLLTQWQACQSSWRDVRGQEFAKVYIEPLRPEISLAIEAIQELEMLIGKARKECE